MPLHSNLFSTQSQDEDEEEEEPFNFDSIVESKIRQAMQNGEFENLPYTGKTLPGTFDLNDSLDRSERVVIKVNEKKN